MTHEAVSRSPAGLQDAKSTIPAGALSAQSVPARRKRGAPPGPMYKADLLQRALENPPVMAAWAVPPQVFVDGRDGAQLVSVQDAGRWVGKSYRTMYRWAHKGWIKYRFSASGIMLVELNSLFSQVLVEPQETSK